MSEPIFTKTDSLDIWTYTIPQNYIVWRIDKNLDWWICFCKQHILSFHDEHCFLKICLHKYLISTHIFNMSSLKILKGKIALAWLYHIWMPTWVAELLKAWPCIKIDLTFRKASTLLKNFSYEKLNLFWWPWIC